MDKLYENIGDISSNHYNYLMNLENVNGVGYGYKYINNKSIFEPCIHVLVENKIDRRYLTKNNIIPKKYMGIKTDVIEVGKLVLNLTYTGDNRYFKERPLEGGCAIGILGRNRYGSMCCIVKKKDLKKDKYNYYILSNNHVMAKNNKAPIGTIITQPFNDSLNNRVAISDAVATLETFVPIKFNIFSANTVDAAIARVLDKSLISKNVIGIGEITGIAEPKLDMHVKRSGAKTGVSRGSITSLNATVFLKKGSNEPRDLLFKKQILAQMISGGGNSGGPVLTNDDRKLVGMHMGGRVPIEGSNFTQISIINDINLVLKKLKVELYLGE